MLWSEFLTRIESNGLFSSAFESFLVGHRFEAEYYSVGDEFAMLCMGGEL